jgi:hypothetical protein
MSHAKLYKHKDQNFPIMQITGSETDIVEGEIITVTEDVMTTLYELESSAGYECQADLIEGALVHYFHKHLYINKHLKSNMLYVGRSWREYQKRND